MESVAKVELPQDELKVFNVNGNPTNINAQLNACSVINIKTQNKSYFLHYGAPDIDSYIEAGAVGGNKINLVSNKGFVGKFPVDYEPSKNNSANKLRLEIGKIKEELKKEEDITISITVPTSNYNVKFGESDIKSVSVKNILSERLKSDFPSCKIDKAFEYPRSNGYYHYSSSVKFVEKAIESLPRETELMEFRGNAMNFETINIAEDKEEPLIKGGFVQKLTKEKSNQQPELQNYNKNSNNKDVFLNNLKCHSEQHEKGCCCAII